MYSYLDTFSIPRVSTFDSIQSKKKLISNQIFIPRTVINVMTNHSIKLDLYSTFKTIQRQFKVLYKRLTSLNRFRD